MTNSANIRRFGWMQTDDPKLGTVKIGFLKKEFSDAEWNEFNEIVNSFVSFRPYLVDYLVLAENFDELK